MKTHNGSGGMSDKEGRLYQRILAASVHTWFHETVLPVWKTHALQIHSTSSQLEKDLQEQTSKLHYHHADLQPKATDSVIIDLNKVEQDKNRLFYSAKITYSAKESDQQWDENEPLISENPSEPCFVGTFRMEKLFRYVRDLNFEAGIDIRQRETESGRKRRRFRKQLFRNPLKYPSGGYKYGNTNSCLCLFAHLRMIILEDFRHDGNSPDVQGRFLTKGGLIFLFFNPKYADKGVNVLQEMMIQHQEMNLRTSAFYLIKVFNNLMSLFLFPSSSIKQLHTWGQPLFNDFRTIIQRYFPNCDVSHPTIISDYIEEDTPPVDSPRALCTNRQITVEKIAVKQHDHEAMIIHVITTNIPNLSLRFIEVFLVLDDVDPLTLENSMHANEWVKQCEDDTSFSSSYYSDS